MKTLNSMINLIDPSERELLGAEVHNAELILVSGIGTASDKEKNLKRSS